MRRPPRVGVLRQFGIGALASGAVLLWACGPRREISTPLPAQSSWVAPPRPVLPAEADTNDARAYFLFGTIMIGARPDTAAAAFYWATQLDPWDADAYYARAVALLRTLMEPLPGTSILAAKRQLREQEAQVIDSLHRAAYDLDPFIHRRFDHLVGPPLQFLRCEGVRDMRASAMCFLHKSDYARALRGFGEALKRTPKEIELHYLRAQMFFRLRHFDSAATELRILADSMEGRQTKKAMLYISRAAVFYAQGMAYTQHRDTAKAREAFERALVEDLSFHMASVRLAGHALATGDTTAALTHLAHAVDLRPADARLRVYYGSTLASANRAHEAAEQLMRAIDANRHYAPAYLHLGRVLERTDVERAVTSYEMYLARAARGDSTRVWTEQRLNSFGKTP
ncbi:MAG TPA: tetratricopeptide repeat protein [Gemmatimonadaceae bacterium]|nr:tetratricopeptide repeat protein [Gemmatimonadaceae bacterium]